MNTTTSEDERAEVRRRIDRLEALAQLDAAVGASPRIRRHLDALHHEETALLSGARRPADEVEQKIGQLKTRLAVAERAVAADLSDDWATFAAGVEGELRGWDTYLERLQAGVAVNAWRTRERAEVAIREIRTCRIAIYDELAHPRRSASDDWQERRSRVSAARDELEQKADELSATLN